MLNHTHWTYGLFADALHLTRQYSTITQPSLAPHTKEPSLPRHSLRSSSSPTPPSPPPSQQPFAILRFWLHETQTPYPSLYKIQTQYPYLTPRTKSPQQPPLPSHLPPPPPAPPNLLSFHTSPQSHFISSPYNSTHRPSTHILAPGSSPTVNTNSSSTLLPIHRYIDCLSQSSTTYLHSFDSQSPSSTLSLYPRLFLLSVSNYLFRSSIISPFSIFSSSPSSTLLLFIYSS